MTCLQIYLMKINSLSIGILISYLLNVTNFYNPMKMLAPVWAQLKGAASAFDRINQILLLHSDLPVLEQNVDTSLGNIAELRNVEFEYVQGSKVLHNISLQLAKGKRYAFVGPTGGGKTTIASLLARLYDPSKGNVFLDGKDIRCYSPEDRTRKIGFILQEPFLFAGTVGENIIYGNSRFEQYSREQIEKLVKGSDLQQLINRFDNGLSTVVSASGTNISLGQKQIISAGGDGVYQNAPDAEQVIGAGTAGDICMQNFGDNRHIPTLGPSKQ